MLDFWNVVGILSLIGIVLFIGITGCATPEQRAEALYEMGRYESVIKSFPDSPTAVKAQGAINERSATRLYYTGRETAKDSVLTEYPTTAVASKIRQERNKFGRDWMKETISEEQKLEEQKRVLRGVIYWFPYTEFSKEAERRLRTLEK